MEKEKALLLWFDAVERKDVALVGGKASSLGELTTKTAVPVPYGFTTTAYAYRCFMQDKRPAWTHPGDPCCAYGCGEWHAAAQGQFCCSKSHSVG